MAKVEDIKANVELKLTGDYGKQIVALKEGIDQLKKRYSELEKTIKDTRKHDKNANVTALLNEQEAAKSLEQEYKRLQKVTEVRAKNEVKKASEEVKKALDEERKALNEETKSVVHAKGSLNDLRQQLKEARKRFDELSGAERKNGTRAKELIAEIKNLDKQVRSLEEATGRHQRSVGMYEKAWGGIKNVFYRIGLGALGAAQAMVQFGNALKSGIETSIRFNREISKLAAITQGSKADISSLEAEAKRLGSTTRYTATQVAELQVELAKLGYGKSDILAMSESVLNLAQATGATLADAAALAGAALRVFGDDSTQLTKYVDQMATAVSKSALSFDYIKTALPIVGGAADMFGFNLQDTLALLGQLANSGMEASMAATATRNIFLKLADSSGVLNKELGKPVDSLEDLLSGLEELRARGANLNDALEMTNVRSAVAFTRFLNSSEAARELSKSMDYAAISEEELRKKANDAGVSLQELRSRMEVCNGTAKDMAEIMEDNLGGEITRLASAWDDFTLSLNGSQGILQWVVEKVKELVTWAGDLIRTVDESEKQHVSKALQEYTQGEEFTSKIDKDIDTYNNRVKELLASGDDMKEAMKKAQLEILGEIDKETNDTLTAQAKSAKAALDEFRKNHKKFSDMSYEEVVRNSKKIHLNLNGSYDAIYKQESEVKKLLQLWDEYSLAQARLESQENRKNAFSTRANKNDNKGGIGAEDDAKRNARLSKEKSAEKALLDAMIAYENAELKIRKESSQKQLDALNNQYKHEIDKLEYKIKVELKMRGDESKKEYADKLAAIDYYEKTIADKRIEWAQESARLTWDWKQKEYKYLKEITDLEIDAIANGSDNEIAINQKKYEMRYNLLKAEQESELAALEYLASKDEKVFSEKERRKTAILQKYENKRIELTSKTVDNWADIRIRESKARELDYASDNLGAAMERVYQARVRIKQLQDENVKKSMSESEYNLQLAEANQQLRQSLDDVTNTRIENATRRLEIEKLIRQTDKENEDGENIRISTEYESAKTEVEIAKTKYDEIVRLGRLETESIEQFELRKAQAYNDYMSKRGKLSDMEIDMMHSVVSSYVGGFESIANAISEMDDKNKAAARIAKILGLAEIWMNSGVAIAKAMNVQASGDPYTMASRMATVISQVATITAASLSTFNKAKFAKGVVNLQGAGTTTSDSIPARLSRGESVMTAKATDRFGALLQIMNQVASQPSVTLPTQYMQYNPMQSAIDSNNFGDTMRDAVSDIHPVVSVTEINSVSERLNNIKVLENI